MVVGPMGQMFIRTYDSEFIRDGSNLNVRRVLELSSRMGSAAYAFFLSLILLN
jgi:hypothetical protein